MNMEMHRPELAASKKSERGAALLTMLLVSILLLSAGLALVTSTSLSTTATIDATAEMQAYAGAEAGLAAVLHVLRGNVAPHASLGAAKMNFRSAANPVRSNKTSDPWATAGATPRLSGWLNYSYQHPTIANDWRVPITANYAPNTGIAFKVTISDPDDLVAPKKITTDVNYQPQRLIIQSEGFGPKGAIKRLELIVQRSAFDFDPPAPLTLPGGDAIAVNLGDSAEVKYSGVDQAVPPKATLPSIAVSAGNLETTQGVIDGLHNDDQVVPNNAAALTDATTPSFVKSGDAARAFLNEMRALASDSGRLFPDHGTAALSSGGLGTTDSPRFTFIDNYGGDAVDLGANHQGSGLLIVTGKLITHGNTDFEGIILVLGNGTMERNGGGEGVLKGAILVCNFDPEGEPGDPLGPPTYNVDGGGNSKVYYDSVWVRNALDLTGFRVVGFREYH